MTTVEEAKTTGTPILVPSGETKGWEVGNDFIKNPDYTPPKVEAQAPIKQTYKCQACGTDMDDQGKRMMRGLSVFRVCENCLKNYAG